MLTKLIFSEQYFEEYELSLLNHLIYGTKKAATQDVLQPQISTIGLVN